MLGKGHEPGIEDKCVSGDSRGFLVSFRYSSVDYEKLAPSLYRAFSVLDLNWNVAVQDLSCSRVQAEAPDDLVADSGIIYEPVVRNCMLLLCFF